MSALGEIVKTCFKTAGLRVTRLARPANRFQAMEETLTLMRDAGYLPKLVLDCGANEGQWTRGVRSIFPKATYHLVEPQPACAENLAALMEESSGVVHHPFALTQSGVASVRMLGGGEEGRGTGNHVALPDESANDEQTLPATTLDDLFTRHVAADDRTLLKLDLEGHELDALAGGAKLLERTEVVLIEIQFYAVHHNQRPIFADVLNFLRDRNFELYDFACLSQRPRDMRLRMGDAVFVQRSSPLWTDVSWE